MRAHIGLFILITSVQMSLAIFMAKGSMSIPLCELVDRQANITRVQILEKQNKMFACILMVLL